MRLPNNMSVRMAAVSAAIVVLLLSAGFTGYRKLGVMEPMKRALSEMEEVRRYEVQGVKGGTRIRVSLSGVDDLAATVARLAEAASSGVAAIGGRQVWLSIEEPRDPLLANAMRQMDFFVQEALATGMFTHLPRAASQIKTLNGIQRCDVGIDADNIYISMANDGVELHRVVPRSGAPATDAHPNAHSREGVRIW